MSYAPPLDRATVEFALRLAPDKCPNPADSEREIWMKANSTWSNLNVA